MNTTLHVTIDRETKQKAQLLAKELGLDISTIVRAGLKQFVQTESFTVQKTHKMTPYLERVISVAKAEPDDAFGPFDTGEEAAKFLRSGKWK